MTMPKFIALCLSLFIFTVDSFAKETALKISDGCLGRVSGSSVENGGVLSVRVNCESDKPPKIEFMGQEIVLFPRDQSPGHFAALIAIPYIQGPIKEMLVFRDDNRKSLAEHSIEIVKGTYRSEKLKVDPSKVTLSDSDKQRADRESAEIDLIYRNINRELLWKQGFSFPMNSQQTSPYGVRRIFNKSLASHHSGLDFRAAKGSKVLAANKGRVVLGRDLFFAGQCVIVDHGYGVYTSYGHLSEIVVKTGEFVDKGSVLALSGNSGRSSGPHLHFGFRINNVSVNPSKAINVINALLGE